MFFHVAVHDLKEDFFSRILITSVSITEPLQLVLLSYCCYRLYLYRFCCINLTVHPFVFMIFLFLYIPYCGVCFTQLFFYCHKMCVNVCAHTMYVCYHYICTLIMINTFIGHFLLNVCFFVLSEKDIFQLSLDSEYIINYNKHVLAYQGLSLCFGDSE